MKGNHIELMDQGSIQIYGQIPFSGEVLPEGTGCMLRGGFCLRNVMSWKRILFLWLLVLAVGSLFGVPILASAVVGALWLGLSMGFIALVNRCMRKRRRRVLEFIAQHMLS